MVRHQRTVFRRYSSGIVCSGATVDCSRLPGSGSDEGPEPRTASVRGLTSAFVVLCYLNGQEWSRFRISSPPSCEHLLLTRYWSVPRNIPVHRYAHFRGTAGSAPSPVDLHRNSRRTFLVRESTLGSPDIPRPSARRGGQTRRGAVHGDHPWSTWYG